MSRLLMLMCLVVACAQSPKIEKIEPVIEPTTPDQNLELDEAFLDKSQNSWETEMASQKKSRKIYLNP